MSNCCKYAKWWPHNWLCLKGLSIFFTVLFYIALAFAIFMCFYIVPAFFSPAIPRANVLIAFAYFVLGGVVVAFYSLAIAKILKALCKIKHAVAPCCCGQETKAEKAPATTEEKKSN